MQSLGAIRHQGQLHRHVLSQGGRVNIDLDDHGVVGELADFRSGTISKTRSRRDNAICLTGRPVGGGGTVHAKHPQPQRVIAGEAAEAHKGRSNRRVQQPGQSGYVFTSPAKHRTAANDEKRPLGLGELLRGTLKLELVGLVIGLVGTHFQFFRPVKRCRGADHIPGQVHQHRTRPPGARQIKGLAQGFRQFLDILDQKVVLGAGPGNADNIDFLKSIVTDKRRGHLPGQDDKGNGIRVGCGNTGDGVGSPGARGDQANPHLPRGPGIAIGGVHGGLFMTHQHMLDRRTGKFVINIVESASGETEDAIYSLAGEAFHQNLRAGEKHCQSSPCRYEAHRRFQCALARASLVYPESSRKGPQGVPAPRFR